MDASCWLTWIIQIELTFDSEDDTREERGKVSRMYNIITGNE